MEIFKFFKLNEQTKISFGELLKTDSSNQSKLRGHLLLNKLENGSNFETAGGKVIITAMLNLADKKYYSINDPIIKPISQLTDDNGDFDPIKAKIYLKYDKL